MPLPITRGAAALNAYGFSTGVPKTVPGAPTIGTATATSCSAISVSFTAPSCTGGLPITGYQAACTSTGTKNATGASSPISVTGLSPSTSYTFHVRAQNSLGYGSYSGNASATTKAATGSQSYTSAGTYSWVAPAGVSSVSVIVVGAGQNSNSYRGGGGGASGYYNNYPVTAGNSYTVKVSAASLCSCTIHSYWISTCVLTAGNLNQGTHICGTQLVNSHGAVFYGGCGANCSACRCCVVYTSGAGGGGAGGYTAYSCSNRQSGGPGLCPQYYYAPGSPQAGAAGGGGTGVGAQYAPIYSGGGGGGIGLFGKGSTGSTGSYSNPGSGGTGGSGGGNGASGNGTGAGGNGGNYGGGGGGHGSSGGTSTGGVGAARIVWPGSTRQFPSTCVGNP